MRLAIAQVQQETGTFLPRRSTLQNFRDCLLKYGQEALSAAPANGEVSGALAAATERGGVEWVPLLAARALPWGPLAHEDYWVLKGELIERLEAAGQLDGMLLVLNGALATDVLGDADGDLLDACRERLGDAALVGSLALHANVTQRMATAADAIVAYRTSPHVDVAETGARAARLLFDAAEGRTRPTIGFRKLPMITPVERLDSRHGPFHDLLQELPRVEAESGVLSASICPVQPWLDVPELGWSTVVVANGDASLAERYAARLAGAAWPRRHEFLVKKTRVSRLVRAAAAAESGVWVVSDSGDNTGGGAAGDSTVLLRAILRHAPQLRALLTITDPIAVAAAVSAGVGADVSLSVGATVDTAHYRPVAVQGRVRKITRGEGKVDGETPAGTTLDLGRTVLMDIGAVTLVLTERPLYNVDPEVFRSLGIEPTDYRLVQTKSACAFRAEWEPIASNIVFMESPGPTTSNFGSLTWHAIPRPLFPLDDVADGASWTGSTAPPGRRSVSPAEAP